jgi:hypothetical protein
VQVLENRRTKELLPSSKQGERVQRIKANEGSTVRRVKTPSQNSLSGGIIKRTSCSNETQFWFAASRDISVSMLHSETVAYHAAAAVEIMTELKFTILAYNCE